MLLCWVSHDVVCKHRVWGVSLSVEGVSEHGKLWRLVSRMWKVLWLWSLSLGDW
jgi:hypothetical protein